MFKFRKVLYLGIALLLVFPVPVGAAESGAMVELEGETYKLIIHGRCSATGEGAYNFWAVTPDENEPDVAKEGAPRLQAISSGQWSRLTFYVEGSEPAAVVFGEGADRVVMTDGSLDYSGPTGEESDQTISIHVDC